jgi:hypothetical protein
MAPEGALLELDVQLKFDDYLRFQYYDSLRRMWWLIPLFLLFAFISLLIVGISAYYQDSYLLRDVIPFASLVFLGGIFIVAGPYLSAKREYEVNPALRQVIRYRLLENALETESPRHKGKLPWSNVKEVRETATAFFVYASGNGAFILPKREFPSAVEVSAFRELLLVILGAPGCKFQLDRISARF